MSQIKPYDAYFMMLAIEQARQGIYTTRPNPAVGCVIVRDNTVVGSGFHPKAGMAHAEVFALKQAQDLAQGATAYVTLEPCSHTGRTPPCAHALIEAGIKRVVIGSLDPNPQVSGRGVSILKESGIEVCVGVATSQAEALNKGFLKAMRTGMPYVRLKIAASLDGRTAMASGESRWITGQAARQDVQRLRALSGAIITGSQTIIDDDPRLNVRSTQLGVAIEQIPQPKVVILDRRKRLANLKDQYHLLSNTNTILHHGGDLKELLRCLVTHEQIYTVLIEAGSQVAGSFIAADLVDEVVVYQAPCFLGSSAKPMLNFKLEALSQQRRFRVIQTELLDEDIKITLQPYAFA